MLIVVGGLHLQTTHAAKAIDVVEGFTWSCEIIDSYHRLYWEQRWLDNIRVLHAPGDSSLCAIAPIVPKISMDLTNCSRYFHWKTR